MTQVDPLTLLRSLYGARLDLHADLYQASEQHRAAHGPECTVYPSSPLNVPMCTGIRQYLSQLAADSRFHTFVIPGFWRAISYRTQT